MINYYIINYYITDIYDYYIINIIVTILKMIFLIIIILLQLWSQVLYFSLGITFVNHEPRIIKKITPYLRKFWHEVDSEVR